MRFFFLVILSGYFTFLPGKSQINQEISAGAGGLFLFGDIGTMGTGFLAHGSWGFFPRADFKIMAGINAAWVSGSDERSRNEDRDLAYSTVLMEPLVQVQFFYWKWWGNGYNRRGLVLKEPVLSAYLSAGFSPVWFSPRPRRNLEDSFEDNFPHVTVSVPIGIGARYVMSGNWSLGWNAEVRMPATDYLDGYTSVHSRANDVYYGTSIHLIYRLPSLARKALR